MLRQHTPMSRGTGFKSEPKERACTAPGCSRTFFPLRPLQVVCSPMCATRKVKAENKAREKTERENFRARKQAAKRLRDLIAEAQVAFNAFIRARDRFTACICCGKPFEDQKPGGSMDAGHYLGRGIAPQHRFNEDNVFGQRKNCNRPGGATRAAFRVGVIERIGLAAVEAMEADTHVPKWSREELEQLKKHYRAKTRALQKQHASEVTP